MASRSASAGGGCVVGLLFLSSSVSPLVGVWGLVGLLFEICIVDASIFTACLSWVCGECVIIFAPWTCFLTGCGV